MAIQVAERVKKIPPYLFSTIDELKEKVKKRGNTLIDLGMGNPDLPTPSHIVERLKEAAMDSSTHRYSSARGDEELRKAIADWYERRYGVYLDFQEEVLPLIGSKEGIAVTYLTFINPGDVAIVPTPAYPVHFNGVLLAGGVVHHLPINKENNFLPDLFSVPRKVLKRAKIIFLCYPNNPTAAIVEREFLEEAVSFARRHNLILANDFSYSEITFDGYRPPSLLQVKGSKEIGIEFHSFSKTYNMAGWRIGFVVGNKDLINSIARVKRYIDFGIFAAIQKAATLALKGPQDCVRQIRDTYRRRRDILVEGLRSLGWEVESPKATMYVWAPLPPRYSAMSSLEFSKFLLEKTGVVVSPGTGFGKGGEGYVRFALVEGEQRISEAVRRIGKVL
ncbi:LL-diaminopimelate aminotransferase [Candidatus Aerophobetes bacterium]|uniref:Aminotransferase n=1 Tax=Aerophobetes bacterium TaxID=2030807 RepID=A0A497E3Z6_UNCAE|nr:MAG: LL-diaminopimelate aminotransferase [Candidatus Aerophobetes bacterium]